MQEIKILPYGQVVYAHNLEYVPENETHKVLWDFELQADHLISASRLDLVIVNNKTC